MILGGSGCQKCSCVPCDPCEQECTEPHTGDPFEVVYTRFFEGVEAGNPTDGYLTATGDSDTDDPYDGMDGSAPWYQQVSGSFSFGPGVTRHPCSINISFWRNSYALGPATVPPAGSTLTYEKIKVTCGSGKIFVGDTILEEGDEYETALTIPLVNGSGDQSESDPRSFEGTVSVRPVCREASFSVQARIQWETQKRQHVLYGKVRECYEDPENPPCVGYACDPPDELYLTLSNITVTDSYFIYDGSGSTPGASAPFLDEALNEALNSIEGTLIVQRVPNLCSLWESTFEGSGMLCRIIVKVTHTYIYVSGEVNYGSGVLAGCNEVFSFYASTGDNPIICLPSYDEGGFSSGTNNGYITSGFSAYGGVRSSVSLDWEIST